MNNNFKTILVSPHSDDVAFSNGGTVLQNIFPTALLLVTIFTRSNYYSRRDNIFKMDMFGET